MARNGIRICNLDGNLSDECAAVKSIVIRFAFEFINTELQYW